MADQEHKRVMIDPKQNSLKKLEGPEADKHKSNARDYILSNFAPILGYAIHNMREKKRIPDDVEDADLYEHAVNGLMHAIHTYEPHKGKMTSHIINKIQGKISEFLKPKDVSSADVARQKHYEKKEGSQEAKTITAKPSYTGRALAETLGGSIGDEEGGGRSGTTIKQSGSASLGQKLTPGMRADLENKVKEHEAKQLARVPIVQAPIEEQKPTNTTPVDVTPPDLGEAKQISPGKKIMVRRAADAIKTQDPDMHQRILAIDQAKNKGGE